LVAIRIKVYINLSNFQTNPLQLFLSQPVVVGHQFGRNAEQGVPTGKNKKKCNTSLSPIPGHLLEICWWSMDIFLILFAQ